MPTIARTTTNSGWVPATAAGLANKGVWKSYPQAMLRSRALAEVIRMGASEVLIGGIYTPEELGAEVDGGGQPVKAQPITNLTPITLADVTAVDESPEVIEGQGELL